MRTLIIDNYDSFTWNLAQYFAQANGTEPIVVHNDQYTWEELKAMGSFDNIVISPGPGSVENDADFHVSRQVIANAQVPVLGVCLGFQGIAHGHGGKIMHAPEPMHGRCSTIWHNNDPLFRDIPIEFQVVRYHSLVAASPLPRDLRTIAFSHDGLIMGLRHQTRPMWGVQFHPESILTEGGHQMVRNFRDLTHLHHGKRVFSSAVPHPAVSHPGPVAHAASHVRHVLWQEVETTLDSEALFVGLYADAAQAFWLDCALVVEGLSRFSFMGAAEQPDDVRTCSLKSGDPASHENANRLLEELNAILKMPAVGGDELPFEFRGGQIGYFGYELKAVCEGADAHQSRYPDAAWFRADHFLAVDHTEKRVYLVAVAPDEAIASAQQWLDDTTARIATLQTPAPILPLNETAPLVISLDQDHDGYLESIAACKHAIVEGESYELCLTNQLTIKRTIQGLPLYRTLRRTNPAPFAAYLRLSGLEILSASPERFLSVDENGLIETKPIKGTCRRDPDPEIDRALAEELQNSEKNRAENLMIVDLLRNDLGHVADCASVDVPELMYIESYATVHQLLSTVTAKLRHDHSLIDLVRATFPGGSITGAPKIRTMQLLDKLERGPRGVYCGSIGYLGYNRLADLNIAIRTIVVEPEQISMGAGGAITYLSDAVDEFDEIMLKAKALVRAISLYVHGEDIDYLKQFMPEKPAAETK